jgi:hypothetical protein
VEVQHLLVPLSYRLHFPVRLVAHYMVNYLERRRGKDLVNFLLVVMGLEAWQERACIVDPLHECMDRVTVCLDARDYDRAVVVLKSLRCSHSLGASLYCHIVHSRSVIDLKCHVFHPVSVFLKFSGETLASGVQRRGQSEQNLSVSDDVSAEVSAAGLETLEKIRRGKDT